MADVAIESETVSEVQKAKESALQDEEVAEEKEAVKEAEEVNGKVGDEAEGEEEEEYVIKDEANEDDQDGMLFSRN